jgi:phage tail P2-like protein
MSLDGAGLIPDTSTAYEKAQAEVSGRLLNVDTAAIRRERDPLQCEAAFVPYLAWERSVHHWAGVDATDRASTASSFADHLSYGAPPALENEIALDTGLTVAITEFFERPQDLVWPEFMIDVVIEPGAPNPNLDGVLKSAIRRKNVRDWPAKLRVRGLQAEAPQLIGATTHVSPSVTILPATAIRPLPQIYVGAALRTVPTVTIAPLKAA